MLWFPDIRIGSDIERKIMPKLYLVPTPIGNLEDITVRAIRILKESDLIAAEDTRHSAILLRHYQVDVPVVSLHAHNEHNKVRQILERAVAEDLSVSVVTDAGTPGISDPGFLIVREAIRMGIEVETLPGASALLPALVNSGFPCERFVFEGFLPVKKGRQTRLKQLKEESRTIVFYESPHRLLKTLEEFVNTFGEDRQAVVARELTKIHEEIRRDSLSGLHSHYLKIPAKGEIVIVVAGAA